MNQFFMLAVQYVITGPYFWASMGFTTAMAMFVGAAIYDGQLPQVRKGVVSVLSYAAMIFWVTISRVNDTTSASDKFLTSTHPEYAYAGIVTTSFVTVAWLLGVLLGVAIFTMKYRNKKHI